jgi:dTDP-4-amino-4,6-dideoxygalactose transaminase
MARAAATKRSVEQAVLAVLRRWDELTPGGGGPIRELEERFCTWLGGRYTLATGSATSAIEVALRAAGIGPGDEVILSAYDWGAAAGAVLRCGARPVFADIELKTATLDPESVQACLSPRTVALVITHLYGCPADMERLLALARRHHLFVLEDCAQALGAHYRGRPVGGFGDAAAFSFGWGKLLSAGEGGMLVLRDESLWRRALGLSQHPLRQFRDAGTTEPYGDLALNARMHPLAAAMVLAQWETWPSQLHQRRSACLRLSEMLRDIPQIEPPQDPPGSLHTFHRYSILILADGITAADIVSPLAALGFPVHPDYVRTPLHLRSLLRDDTRQGKCPQAERRCRSSFGLDLKGNRISRKWGERFAHALGRILRSQGAPPSPVP